MTDRRPPTIRAVPESGSDIQALPDLRSGRTFRRLPVWGQVAVLCSIGLGASAGAVVGGVAKVLGVQTTAAATADKAELAKDIAAVKQGQQASDAVDAKNHADMTVRVDAIQKSLAATNASIRALTRQLVAKRPAKPVPNDE